MTALNIPKIESPTNLSEADINAIKKYGVAFVKLPEETASKLKLVTQVGREFFTKPDEFKKQFAFNDVSGGYIDHYEQRSERIERFSYRGKTLPEQFTQHKDAFDNAKLELENDIGLPVLKKLFESANIGEHFAEATKNHGAPFSLVYYPESETPVESQLKEHQDTVMLTLLYISEPGLEVLLDGEWYEVNPLPGYILLNLGKTLELMTNDAYPAIYHRVEPPKNQDRLSIAFFIAPNPDIPLTNYVTGEKKYENFKAYFKEHIRSIYPELDK